jgi:S-methylmethionine-dependent homocysteine/selenocysteine methylase
MSTITLLDGGMGQEIVKRTGDAATPLWSTQSMIDHPGIVEGLHRDYYNAGATIATANTYAIHRDRLRKFGLEDRFETLMQAALSEVNAARKAHGSGRVAGSIGPLGASYRPDLTPDFATARDLFAEVADLLAPHVDLIIVETVASVDHARAALAGCANSGRPVWLAVTVDDTNGALLRSGEGVGALMPVIQEYRPDAVLVNCSVPEAMEAALEIVRGFGLPFGAYANGFTSISADFLKESPTVDALEARDDLGPATYANFALHWVGMGATIIGGCCETSPAHIAEIARRLTRSGFQIT